MAAAGERDPACALEPTTMDPHFTTRVVGVGRDRVRAPLARLDLLVDEGDQLAILDLRIPGLSSARAAVSTTVRCVERMRMSSRPGAESAGPGGVGPFL
jgi:hypothetical protein